MKNIFKLFFLIVVNSYSQQNLQNSNWVFGSNNTLNINNQQAGLLLSGNSFVGSEGVASVSDRNGNLLLYSDGINLWHHNQQTSVDEVVTNLLLGSPSSASNTIFIPKPNHQNSYYIVTINGSTGIFIDGKPHPTRLGLYYSEVEINCGIASMVSLNIPLRDNNGILIDINYDNRSEAISSSVHFDSLNYWLIAHVQHPISTNQQSGSLLTFLVDENGIGVSNGSLNNLPSSSLDLTLSELPGPFFNIAYFIKISTDTNNIAISTSNGTGIFTGNFNNQNGNISLFGNITNTGSYYGIEFSVNSNILYYKTSNAINKILFTNPLDFSSIISNNVTNPRGMQLGVDGKIYITKPDLTSLDVIEDPNNVPLNPFVNGSIIIQNNAKFGLPQWVHVQQCQSDLINDLDVLSTNIFPLEVQRNDWIKHTNTIENSSRAISHAGNFIELLPTDNCDGNGFEAEYGSEFVAYIEGCTGNFVYKNGNGSNQSFEEKEKYDFLEKEEKGLSVVPNPSSNSIEILMKNSTFNKVIITSTDGKIVLDKNIDNSESFQVDVSNYANGLYIVNVIDKEGQVYNQKLIKN